MIKTSVIEIENKGKTSEHTFYANENSNKLVVIFPGGNNSCDVSLLRYLRKLFLTKGYDILCLSYKNLSNREGTPDQNFDEALSGINKAFAEIEFEKQYKEKIFISRSFGNVFSGELRSRCSIEVNKSIYVSPISKALKYLNEFPGFIISGTKDEYLTSDEMIELAKLGNDKVLIFKEGSHSLESDSVIDTIDFIKTAIIKVEEFILK